MAKATRRGTTASKKTATKKTTTKKTAKASVASKKTAVKRGPPNGPTGRPTGKTTGLGVTACWVHLFVQNGKAPRKKRMTDDGITAFMYKEYPGRKSKVFSMIQAVRGAYNAGKFTGGEVPVVQSVRYDDSGNPNPPRHGAVEVPNVRGGKKTPTKKTSGKKKAGRKAAAVTAE